MELEIIFFQAKNSQAADHERIKMTTTVKNEKGLFGRPASLTVHKEVLLPLIAAAAQKEDAAALRWIDSLLSLGSSRFKQGRQWPEEALSENTAKGWLVASGRLEPEDKRHWSTGFLMLEIPNILSGFGNETAQWSAPAAQLAKHWETLAEIAQGAAAALSGLAGGKVEEARKNLMKELPTKAAMAKMKSAAVQDLEEGWEAKGGEAWAIWMGSAREQGYMDDKKRPGGAASARLFESSAAALRTAKLAKFGADRGPASIVRLRVECVEITSSAEGSSCSAVRMQMAKREAQEISESMESASLDQIRQALGEPTSEPAQALAAPEAGSLAGREDGYGSWVDEAGNQSKGGFLNIRGEAGPLTGAVLKSSAAGAKGLGYWQASVIKVSCWPVAIDETIGEPKDQSVRAAIEWERAAAEESALKKQDADALRARAQALMSGQAAPRRRASRL